MNEEIQNESSRHLSNSSVNRISHGEIRFEEENKPSRVTDTKTGNNETRINLSKGKSVVARTADQKISGVPARAPTTFTIRMLLKTITVCRPSSSRGGKVSAGTTSSNGRECFTQGIPGRRKVLLQAARFFSADRPVPQCYFH